MFTIMTSTVVVGGFFGDEGKGKIISYLAIKDDPKIIVRGGAGPNAGHTIMDGDKVYLSLIHISEPTRPERIE